MKKIERISLWPLRTSILGAIDMRITQIPCTRRMRPSPLPHGAGRGLSFLNAFCVRGEGREPVNNGWMRG